MSTMKNRVDVEYKKDDMVAVKVLGDDGRVLYVGVYTEKDAKWHRQAGLPRVWPETLSERNFTALSMGNTRCLRIGS